MRRIACLSALLLSALNAQQPVERTYDLTELVRPLPGVSRNLERPSLLLPTGPVLPNGESTDWSFLPGGNVRPEPIAAPWLPQKLLVNWLEQLWDQERGTSDTFGQALSLRAPMGVQTQVQDLLTLLKAIRGQSRTVTLFELPGKVADSQAAVLSAQQVAALLQARPPVQGTRATVGHDVPWLWESGRSLHYVRDLDVEVAEESSISDPKLDVFFVGTRVGLGLTPMIDGRCLVRVGVQATELPEPLAPRNLPGKKLGVIHLPRVEVQEIAGTAVLAAGGGLLLTADGGDRSWLLRVDASSPAPLQFGSATAVPLGDLAVANLGPAPPLVFTRRPGDDRRWRASGRATPDGIAALNGLGGAVASSAGHAQFGSHAVLVGANANGAGIEAALRKHAKSVRTTSLTFRLGTVDKARGLAALAGTVTADVLASTLKDEVQVATLPGHEFHARRGREVAFVRDYEVEIAGKAAVANPVVSATFAGYRVSGTLRRKPGRSNLDLRLEWGALPPVAIVDLGNEDLGAVDTPAVAWTDVERSVAVEGDGWQVAHIGPDPSAPQERSLVLMVRVR